MGRSLSQSPPHYPSPAPVVPRWRINLEFWVALLGGFTASAGEIVTPAWSCCWSWGVPMGAHSTLLPSFSIGDQGKAFLGFILDPRGAQPASPSAT